MIRKLNIGQLKKIDSRIKVSENKYIVMLDESTDKNLPLNECNQNIYMVDNENIIIWQVQGESRYTEFAKQNYPTNIPRQRDGFVGISKNDKGEIFAYRFHGDECQINIETGEAKRIGWSKS